MKRLPTLLLSTTLLIGACLGQAQGTAPADPPAGLGGRTFLSVGVTDGGAARPLAPGTRLRLNFNADGTMGASAGCNSIGGTYRLEGPILRVQPGAMTEMGCDPERHAQDDWLIDFLGSDPALTLAGNDLRLQSGEIVIQLLDREIAEPDQPLTGTIWTLDSLRDGDAVSSIPDGARATLQIAPDGTVDLDTGCNEGSGRATIDGGQVQFVDLVTTDRACADARGDVERAFMAVLQSASVAWSVDAGRLTLDAGPIGLHMVAG